MTVRQERAERRVRERWAHKLEQLRDKCDHEKVELFTIDLVIRDVNRRLAQAMDANDEANGVPLATDLKAAGEQRNQLLERMRQTNKQVIRAMKKSLESLDRFAKAEQPTVN